MGRFRTATPVWIHRWLWNIAQSLKRKGEVPYCFPRSSIKFQGHTGQNITDFDPNWAFPDYRPVAAFKSLRFALLFVSYMFYTYVFGYMFKIPYINTLFLICFIIMYHNILFELSIRLCTEVVHRHSLCFLWCTAALKRCWLTRPTLTTQLMYCFLCIQ